MPTKILAIDDSKTMRLAIKITFAAEDADVTSVSKGSEAVARAKQMGADVVLVDANLAAGEPSGYEVCRALKSDPATANIPVMILVSGQEGVDQAQLTAVGGDDWLAKPFDTQELIDKIAAVRAKPVARPAGGARPAAAAAAAADDADAAQSGKRARPQNRTQMGMPSPAAPPRATAAQAPAVAAPTAVAPAKPAVAKPAVAPASVASKPAAPAAPPPSSRAPATAAAAPAAKPAAAPAAAQRPAVAAKPAAAAVARPGAASGGAIPIAIPIPFTAADAPTPGMVERLRQAAGAAGVDPRVAEAIAALSREVIEAIVWEVVPELAESIIRQQQPARSA
jgi:CheY-like chemotaxis protein